MLVVRVHPLVKVHMLIVVFQNQYYLQLFVSFFKFDQHILTTEITMNVYRTAGEIKLGDLANFLKVAKFNACL